MKNTIRVHRNGDTQTASAQTKIPRAKQPSAQTVRIILHDKNGDVVVDLDIPEVLHAAMLRSAKRQGISFQQWIKNDKLELQVLSNQSIKDGGAR
jgi:hypothetical protein